MGVVEVSSGRCRHFCLCDGGDIVHDALTHIYLIRYSEAVTDESGRYGYNPRDASPKIRLSKKLGGERLNISMKGIK